MFIAFEGIDGAGKSTQARMLHEHLSGKGVKNVLTKEHTHGTIGALIDNALYNMKKPMVNDRRANLMALQLLFVADRAEHIYNFIKPKEEKGYVVISDRYLMSTIAYGMASGIERDWLATLNRYFPRPDLTILIDVDPDNAMERLGKRVKKARYYEKLEFMKRTRKAYLRISKDYPNCFVLDGNLPTGKVSERINSMVDQRLKTRR